MCCLVKDHFTISIFLVKTCNKICVAKCLCKCHMSLLVFRFCFVNTNFLVQYYLLLASLFIFHFYSLVVCSCEVDLLCVGDVSLSVCMTDFPGTTSSLKPNLKY